MNCRNQHGQHEYEHDGARPVIELPDDFIRRRLAELESYKRRQRVIAGIVSSSILGFGFVVSLLLYW